MRNNWYATNGGAMSSRVDFRTTNGLISEDSSWWINNSITHSSVTTGDIVMFAVDLVNGKVWVGKNGTWAGSGDPANGTNPGWTYWEANVGQPITNFTDWLPYIQTIDASDSCVTASFGGSAFAHTVPTGFSAWGGTGGGISVVQAAGAPPSATATANVRHAPGAGTVNATGLAPTAERSYRLAVPAGDVQAVGLAPTARRSFSIPVAACDVHAVGLAPTESHTAVQTVSPGAGSVTATGLAPDLGRSYRIAVPKVT